MFFSQRKQDRSNFCCIPCIFNSCMEKVWLGMIYYTFLDSNQGNLSPHTSQTVYFSNIYENKYRLKTTAKNKSLGGLLLQDKVLFLSSLVVRRCEGDKTAELLDPIIQLWGSIRLFVNRHLFQIMQPYLNYGVPSNEYIEFYVTPFF